MARGPVLGRPAPSERRAIRPRRILSLWGGGFRGLFTARLLERLEGDGPPLRDRFDLIGGTSIGGILALGLACGVPSRVLREEVESRGPRIFRPRKLAFGGWLKARYGPGPLEDTVRAIAGSLAETPIAELPAAVAVTAVDQTAGQSRLFLSASAAPDGVGDKTPLVDVALATSAAPTYFPPHAAEGSVFLDGGLIANAPDLLLATLAMRRFAVELAGLKICSIGTAGGRLAVRPIGDPGTATWLHRHRLFDLTLGAQAFLSVELAAGLLPGAVLSLDAEPEVPIKLDDVHDATCRRLLALADETFERADPIVLAGFMGRSGG